MGFWGFGVLGFVFPLILWHLWENPTRYHIAFHLTLVNQLD
ncbi:MAG: hypothetical protein ACKO96_29965 [Flammeovirgaceae bacterium]